MSDPTGEQPSRSGGLWASPKRKWLLGIPIGGFLFLLAGMGLYAGAGAALHATSSEEFCAYACHDMADFTTPAWKQSVHYKTRTGVHAGCPDCHVPGPFVPKMIRKVQALNEGYQHILGTIGTQEKYNAKKAEMAQHVWDYMKKTDSRECRACHSADRMDPDKQSTMAQKAHAKAKLKGKTCIECHQGVAHELPPDPEAPADVPAATPAAAPAPAAGQAASAPASGG
jgi:cytochrome c-type protein NapC